MVKSDMRNSEGYWDPTAGTVIACEAKQIRRGDICYIKIPYATGHEMEKDRPGIIVSCDELNKTSPCVNVVFCTGADKEKVLPEHVPVRTTPVASTALCEQIYTVDKSRISKCVGHCTEAEMSEIKAAIMAGLALAETGVAQTKTAESPAKDQKTVMAVSMKAELETYKRLYESLLDRVLVRLGESMSALMNGEKISGNRAGAIASNDAAVSILENATGQKINMDAPISEAKAAIRSVADTGVQAQSDAVKQENAPAQEKVTSFGKNGEKALYAAYDSKMDTREYFSEFSSFYKAGVSGIDMDTVQSKTAGTQLSDAQKYAAYTSGQNDAAESLAREKQAAQFAKTAGTDSGLVYDDFVQASIEGGSTQADGSAYLDNGTADKINSVAKLLGVRVRFVDSVRGGTANAQISGSDILVEKNNQNPVMYLLGHEWTHRLQELAPTEYRAFRDAVAETADGEAGVVLKQYRAAGEGISYESALDEAAANYAGRMIEDGKVLDDFIEQHRKDRTLLEKVRDAIRSIVAKLTGAEKKQAQTAEGKLTAALEASAKQTENLDAQKNTAQEGGEARYSIKTVDGKPVVWIENSSMTNKELNSHKAVADYIAQHIGEVYTILESGQSVYIGDDLPGEYTQSGYTSYLRSKNRSGLKAKNKALDGLGELIETASNRRWEKTKHTHSKDARYGMYRYDSSFAFGTTSGIRAYDVELLIRNASDGKKYLYDIVGVKENTTVAFDLLQREARRGGHTAATRDDVSTDSISNSGEKSNTKFSLKTDSEGRNLTEEQREYFHGSKAVDS